MNNGRGKFLIPANSKKSELYFGVFNTFDLILFCSGVGITILLMMVITTNDFWVMIMILIPSLVVSFLVFPVPYYHNVLQLIINIYTYFSRQRIYKWGGWNYKNIKKLEIPKGSSKVNDVSNIKNLDKINSANNLNNKNIGGLNG